MQLRVAALTDRGRVRPQNEDAFLVRLPLLAVADGMGGHRAGEVASRLALEVLERWRDREGNGSPERLGEAVREANAAVFTAGQQDRSLEGMGTTLTAAWVSGSTATVAHVGDSRAWLLRGGVLSRLTEDHTLVQQWVDEGKLTADEAPLHPYRSILTQALGVEPDVEVEVLSVDLQPGDRLLLSTDGLHGPLAEDRIRDILLRHHDPQEACRSLVEAANAAGGEDNITVVLLDAVVEEGPTAPEAAGGPVIVTKPPARPQPWRRPRRLRWAGLAAGVAVLVGLVLAGTRDGGGYLVGARRGRVAILKGRPGPEGGEARARVVRVTDVPLASVAEPYQRDLRRGIPVPSLEEAERRIRALPRRLGPTDTPTPSPTLPPSPSP